MRDKILLNVRLVWTENAKGSFGGEMVGNH